MSVVRLVQAKFSHKGICRYCGIDRGEGNHKNCDRTRPEVTFIGNSVNTTVADLKKFVDLLPQDHHIFFRVQVAGVTEPLLEGERKPKRKRKIESTPTGYDPGMLRTVFE